MSTLIPERIRDALACPVEHPVPLEIFSHFEDFNPMTMEIVGDLSDDEIRIIRLMNELGCEKIRIKLELREKKLKSDSSNEVHFTLNVIEMEYDLAGRFLLASLFRRLLGKKSGDFKITSNGKVASTRKTPLVTH